MSWVITAQKQITAEMYADLQYFRLLYELGTPTIFLPCVKHFVMDLDVDIKLLEEILQETSAEELVARLCETEKNRENTFIPELAKGLEWGDFELTADENLLEDLLADKEAVIGRLFHFIAVYRAKIYDAYHIDSIILSEIERATTSFHQLGFQKALNQLQVERMVY